MDPSSAFLVTLLTFNTGLLSVGGVDVVPRVDERRAQQAQVLDGWAADHPEGILVLQEVWNIPRADVLVKHLEARNWTVWLPPQRAGWGATSGLLLAAGSAYTVLDRGFERFEARLGWEALSAKGTAWFRLRMPGGADFVVLNTHLAAVDTKEGQLVDARQLPLYRSQVEQVKELAVRVSGVTGLWLLAGDFNAGELAAPEAWALWGTDRFPGTDLQSTPALVTWDSANALVLEGLFPDAGTADLDHVLWPSSSGVSLVSAQTVFSAFAPLSDHEALESSLTLPSGGTKLWGE